MARYGTQFGLEETTVTVANYTWMVISETLNMVGACRGKLNG